MKPEVLTHWGRAGSALSLATVNCQEIYQEVWRLWP